MSDQKPISDSLLEHMVRTPSQYDSTCRALAEELLQHRQSAKPQASGDNWDIGGKLISIVKDGSWIFENRAGTRRRLWPETDTTRSLEAEILKLQEVAQATIKHGMANCSGHYEPCDDCEDCGYLYPLAAALDSKGEET